MLPIPSRMTDGQVETITRCFAAWCAAFAVVGTVWLATAAYHVVAASWAVQSAIEQSLREISEP